MLANASPTFCWTGSKRPDVRERVTLSVGDVDEFYGAPAKDGFAADVRDIVEPAIWVTQVDGGPDLLSYVSVADPSVLYVTFHGAVRLQNDRYPRFDRIGSSARLGRSVLAFADPTLTLSPSLRLSWYLGGRAWDPIATIVQVIERVTRLIYAKRVVLVGGSGGGFAAMRIGQFLPDALVYVFSPQSAVLSYRPQVVAEYFEAGFPGEQVQAVVDADPGRFSMRSLYRGLGGNGPTLYYLQSVRDPMHLVDHYGPMKTALGVETKTGHTGAGNVRFMTYEAVRPGHGPPTADEFELHLQKAFRLHDRVRASRGPT